ncbi:hypothetical protein DFH09DRAFT_1084937 [Mycena vulgaris]|nr:hypothetical protein DFH09DRAFT_1084937 [Mycena vulgaris]
MPLSKGEIYWRDHQIWLQECGYILRPPAGSTLGSRIQRSIASYGAFNGRPQAHLKEVHPDEAYVFEYFSLLELASNPRNHYIPLLVKLLAPDNEDKLIFLMKLMRPHDSPRFDPFGDVGLKFIHHHRVADRYWTDSSANTYPQRLQRLDGQHLFPHGFHPQVQGLKPEEFRHAKYYTRTQRPVKYYPIDFGLSHKFAPGEIPHTYIIEGGDGSPSEFGTVEERRDLSIRHKLVDPFPTDIYYVGNMIRRWFLDAIGLRPKFGFDFIRPLVADMVQDDAAKRPTIDEVVFRFAEIQRVEAAPRVVKKSDFRFNLPRMLAHWVPGRVGYGPWRYANPCDP